MPSPKPTRRDFVKGAAASALAFTIMPATAKGANERIQVGCIGIGGKGAADSSGVAAAGGQIMAICDVADPKNPEMDGKRGKGRNSSFKKYPDANFYFDFREMLNQEKGIDAVTVSTPDHVHYHASMAAMKKGIHVYCQKPLSHSIHEAREMTEAARKYKIKTNMGNQAHADEPIRRGVELIRAGVIGKVRHVHTWTNRPIWPQGVKDWPKSEPIPDGLKWDLWLGPADVTDYSSKIAPFSWRGYWRFGTGALGDMGCHIMDMPFWALELGSPISVSAKQEGNTDISGPNGSIITYEFLHQDGTSPITFNWYDGTMQKQEHIWKEHYPTADHVYRRFDMMLEGDRGKMFFGRRRTDWALFPENLKEGTEDIPKSVPRIGQSETGGKASGGPYVEWLNAIKNDGKTEGDFDYSGPFTETVLLGNLAIRLGKKIQWDGKTLKATNAPEADTLIKRTYRDGWTVV